MKAKHKNIGLKVTMAFLIIQIMASAGCGSKSQTEAEKNTGILVSSGWKISTVTVDNTDQTAMYSNMTLSFTATDYTTTNGKVVWPASGKWSFVTSDGKVIKRDDGLDVTITDISDSKLTLELDWTKTTLGGRVGSTAGHHVFNFIR